MSVTAQKPTEESLQEFNVYCNDCGHVWNPAPKSPLWWRALQHSKKYIDALCIQGTTCGCIKKIKPCTTPYRVFGYDFECVDFDYHCTSFVEAVQTFRRLSERPQLNTVCIRGVCDKVLGRLGYY